MDKIYRIAETKNHLSPKPDLDRLDGLARRFAKNAERENDWVYVMSLREFFEDRYHEWKKNSGVCGAMVCEWSWLYLIGEDPTELPREDTYRKLMGDQYVTAFKRVVMDKPNDPVEVAKEKMYASQGLKYSDIPLVNTPAPVKTIEFYKVAKELASKITPSDGVPFLLGMATNPNGNQHAVGLTKKSGLYYVLEPNQGLFRYASETLFTGQLAIFFQNNLRPRGKVALQSISLNS